MTPEQRTNIEPAGKIRLLLILMTCLFSFALTAQAATTFQVTTTADNGDNANPTPGSLRQAIIMANSTPGTDTISFNIGMGAQTITPLSALPAITDPVIIDGTTQPGFAGTPIIEIKGTSAGSGVAGLQISAGSSTVRGLVINRFSTGIFLNTKGNNLIAGNYIGTDITGTVAQSNSSHGIDVQGSNNNTFGGTTAADRNLISGNGNNGLRLSGSSSNIVLGNYIGTDASGSSKLGNGNQNLRMENSQNNKIGGTAQGEGNIISGSGDSGIILISAFGNTIAGNRIGTDITGTLNLGNASNGLTVLSGTGNVISANTIAFNGALGIELDVNGSFPLDGVTPNDAGDADTGSNNLQNFPVLTTVSSSNGTTTITGTLNSEANKQYRIEFFSSTQANASGYGEGQTFLGFTDVTTSGNDASINATLPVTVPVGYVITATATDPNGNTSEFSNSLSTGSLPGSGTLQLSASTYSVNENGGQATITVMRTSSSTGAISVQYTTAPGGTATAGSDYTSTSGTLNWADGDSSSKTFTVTIKDDSLNEAPETINLALSNPANGATLGSPATAVLTINDNDPQPTLSIDDVTVTEGNSGVLDATFTVTLSAQSGQTVTVNAATVDNTAKGGQDFQPLNVNLTFNPGQTSKSVSVAILGDADIEPDELFSVMLSSPTNATITDNQGVCTIKNDDLTPPLSIQLSQANYSVNEDAGSILITITRSGDVSAAATVDYNTQDGNAQQKADYNIALGTLKFAPGETSKTVQIFITDDAYVEGGETFALILSNPAGGTLGANSSSIVMIADNDSAPSANNPIDDSAFFVRQHYVDFLNREPEPGGFQAWKDILKNCAQGDTKCDRIEVSSGFFRSPEFQERGYFTYRFYSAGFGRKPDYAEFMADLAKVSGFLTDAEKEAHKVAFIAEFMNRQEFKNRYDSTLNNPAGFVDGLLQAAGLPNHPSRAGWVAALTNQSLTRAQVLRELVESAEVYQKYYNEAFVVMQYFGYLRRDPDVLYLNWIQTLNQTGDYRTLVNGFVNSLEYRQRFNQ